MVLQALPGLFVMVGFIGWAVTAVCAFVLATAHRLPEHGALWYAVNGWAFYSAANFAPSGAGLHRVMVGGMVVFVGAVAAGIAAAAIGATSAQ